MICHYFSEAAETKCGLSFHGYVVGTNDTEVIESQNLCRCRVSFHFLNKLLLNPDQIHIWEQF